MKFDSAFQKVPKRPWEVAFTSNSDRICFENCVVAAAVVILKSVLLRGSEDQTFQINLTVATEKFKCHRAPFHLASRAHISAYSHPEP